jgi:Na+/H+ antiporter NhaD/arsenite permease-like protein
MPPLAAGLPPDLSLLWTLPFAGLLLCIAVLPLVAHHWWERNRNRGMVTAAWALPVFGLLVLQDRTALGHAAHEYFSFLCLLGSLFIISGGILLQGDVRPTPRNNALVFLFGGVLANIVGTTGASMLLIRPLLRMNASRKHTIHIVVFFIFIVSNCGGCLTPLGDPPLFMGFQKGVPFAWTLGLWKEWAFVLGALLAIFLALDTVRFRAEEASVRGAPAGGTPLSASGGVNFALLGGVVASVLLLPDFWREGGMVAATLLSLRLTPKGLREANGFHYGPIQEVAILFAGIFVAMVPALKILEARGPELGVSEPWQFFAATGLLSSFLDNAPTYLAFLAVAKSLSPGYGEGELVALKAGEGAVPAELLVAISLGAVFMGAMTYIGNGPNFMVKAIAEGAGQRMPSFFGYAGWAVAVLGPLLAVMALVFLV